MTRTPSPLVLVRVVAPRTQEVERDGRTGVFDLLAPVRPPHPANERT